MYDLKKLPKVLLNWSTAAPILQRWLQGRLPLAPCSLQWPIGASVRGTGPHIISSQRGWSLSLIRECDWVYFEISYIGSPVAGSLAHFPMQLCKKVEICIQFKRFMLSFILWMNWFQCWMISLISGMTWRKIKPCSKYYFQELDSITMEKPLHLWKFDREGEAYAMQRVLY